jgi:hypothetical protein
MLAAIINVNVAKMSVIGISNGFKFSYKVPLLPIYKANPIHPLNQAWLNTQRNKSCCK